jgi:hypothetical protein
MAEHPQTDVSENRFGGEYWNSDAKTSAITRVHFVTREGKSYVSAWGSCFPKDCEWGETELHLLATLDDENALSDAAFAFATWDSDDGEPNHCLMTLVNNLLTVDQISLRSTYPSYKVTGTFRKDAAKSTAALNPDPIAKFQHMWDGSEPGWKLVQHPHPVFQVEIDFDESGPTRAEFPTLLKFIRLKGCFEGDSDEVIWERLRGCGGMTREYLGPNEIGKVREIQSEGTLRMHIHTIEPNEYLVMTPNGGLYGWLALEAYRRQVVERMLDAGVPVVSRAIE